MPITEMPRSKEYLHRIRERLRDDKVSHCIFTAEYLASFSPSLDIDHDEAIAAGLLHDYCRNLKKNELLKQARIFRLPLSDSQIENPALLHGPVAAEICQKQFGISANVYEAIYWHTTGRPALGILGQALYVADFSEPTRKFPEAAKARQQLRVSGFASALLYVAEMKFTFCQMKKVIDPNTQAFLLWLRNQN